MEFIVKLLATGTGEHYGFYNLMSGTSNASKYGLYNFITNNGSAPQFGVRNQIVNGGIGNKYGTFNSIAAFNANGVYGTYNFIDGGSTGDRFGTYNQLTNSGSGRLYGSFTVLSGSGSGIKFGDYIAIANSVPGTHYGVYSDVNKAGSFAGYFRGNLAVGTTDYTSGTPNYYIFPSNRGTNGQVMQTDGSGNLSWVDASGLGDSDADFFEEGTTNPPDDINDDIYTLGNLAIGKNTADYPLEIQTSTLNRGLNINVAGTDNATKYGNYTAISNTGAGLHYGNVIELNSGSGQKFGNRILITGTGGSIGTENNLNTTGFSGTTGTLNAITGDAGQLFGTFNFINGSGNGQHYGVRNQISTTGDADLYGTLNQINFSSGSGAKYGSINTINQASGGTHYGVFSEVLKTNSYAGYFLGNVSIGTTTTNNYILPPSRGTSGQFMQTDGSGNLSWVSLPTQTNDWSITGNSGTNPAVNFIGTTDNVALSFRTNNIQRLQIDNNIVRTYGDFQINDPSNTTQSGLLQNDDNFVHAVDTNIDFGAGGNHVMLSSQEGGSETGGIHLDGNSVSIWSPADNFRALRILDEDNWNDNNGNPYDNGAELAYIDNTGQYVQASDQNRKQDIKKITQALSSIIQLNGYTYEYKLNTAEIAKREQPRRTSGVLAQELQKVLPEAVQVSEDGEYFVHYAGITPLLIEAIKELKQENEVLKQNQDLMRLQLSRIELLLQEK
ncbi:tail fiber domain-containing protein [Flavobacterium piscinae]|uniref:tail fiber domain-containing protein n=1 Tax=Flavobacterium piscinae TaxID=2506424 RepID=UPI002AABDF8F|nr:tail fiber domain-containing protein [Flavobacterium piscinae]